MNNDSLPILPKNLHLLSDNDTNQSISNTEKFKNLSNLMIDDKDSYSENCFIRNSEDRLILELYTTLGRQAKEIFLEEKNTEKLAKRRLLFHKLNDIKIPRFGFNIPLQEENDQNEKNKKEKGYNEDKEDNSINSLSKNSEEEKKDKEKEEEEKKEEKEEEECYFKKKEKGYFLMPNLIDIKEYKKIEQKIEKENLLNENFWGPEIDSNILSCISLKYIFDFMYSASCFVNSSFII